MMDSIVQTSVNASRSENSATSAGQIVPTQMVVTTDFLSGTMIKLTQEDLQALDIRGPIEIRAPYTKRFPQERGLVIELVDKDYKTCGILANDVVVSAIKFAPNPQSFVVNSSKIVNRSNTMTRWVELHWSDEIDNVTFTGSTYSFFAYNLANVPDVGLTKRYRTETQAYLALRELEKVFNTNGIIYQDYTTYEGRTSGNTTPVAMFLSDPDNAAFKTSHPRVGLAKERLYMRMTFDYITLLGYFETFDVSEDSSTPYKFTYSAIFKSEKTVYNFGNLSATNVR